MNHTKKMVVVPQDVMENLRFNQKQQVGAVGKQLMDVDREIKEIFDREDLAMDEKLTLYYDVLQKYRKLDKQYNVKPATILKEVKVDIEPPGAPAPSGAVAAPVASAASDEWLDRIDKQFNVRNHDKAEQLYQWVKDKSDLRWNEKGELDGVPKSNILTLIDDVTRPMPRHKDIEPVGLSQFVSKLRESNLPEYLIGNTTHYKKYYTPATPATVSTPATASADTTSAEVSTPVKKKRAHRLVSPNAVPVPTPHIGTPEAKTKGWLTMDDI